MPFFLIWRSDDHQSGQFIAGNKSNGKQWLTYRIVYPNNSSISWR